MPSRLAEARRRAVGAEREAPDLVGVAEEQRPERSALLRVPQPDPARERAGRKRPAVGAERDRPKARAEVAAQDRLGPGAARGGQGADHRVRRLRRLVGVIRREREEQRALDARAQPVPGGRGESDRGGRPGGAPRLAALDERPDAEGAEREREQQEPARDLCEPLDRGPAAPVMVVVATPLEDRLGEDVVEELVPGCAAAGRRGRDTAKDAAALGAAQPVEHDGHPVLAPARPVGEIGGGMGDLRLRARDEVAEHVGGCVALRGCQRRERLEQVVLHDPLGAAERREAGNREVVPARGDRGAPHALEHELEEGRLDVLAVALRLLLGTGDTRQGELARRRCVEDALDELRLERERRRAGGQAPVPFLDRTLDRRGARRRGSGARCGRSSRRGAGSPP